MHLCKALTKVTCFYGLKYAYFMKPLIGNSSLLSIHTTHRCILWNVLERYAPVGEESVLQLNSFPGGSAGKESACYARDLGSIPGFGRSPGKGMAPHSSILAWRFPRTVQSMELQRVRHD